MGAFCFVRKERCLLLFSISLGAASVHFFLVVFSLCASDAFWVWSEETAFAIPDIPGKRCGLILGDKRRPDTCEV